MRRKATPQRKRKAEARATPDMMLEADVYHTAIHVFTDYKRCQRFCEQNDLERIPFKEGTMNGCAARLKAGDGVKWFVVYLAPGCNPDTIAHEFLHISWMLLKTVGVEVRASNHEALAHLMSSLIRQFNARVKWAAASWYPRAKLFGNNHARTNPKPSVGKPPARPRIRHNVKDRRKR